MLSQKIKRKRIGKGYSQDHMADQLGITSSAYGKIERGETKLDIDRLKQIAKALEVDIIDLLNDESIVVMGNNKNSTIENNGVAINPSYHSDKNTTKVWEHMVEHFRKRL